MSVRALFDEPSGGWLYGAASLAKRACLLPRSTRLRQVALEIASRPERPPLRACYLGDGESVEYFTSLYRSEMNVEDIGAVPVWRLRGAVKELLSAGEVVLVEINRLIDSLVPEGGFLTFPWIRQRVYFGDGVYAGRKGRIEASFGRRVRKYGYQQRVTKDPDAVIRFHHELYAPFIRSRYGEMSHLRTIEELQAAVRAGFLLQVFDGGIWVSGAVCRLRGNQLTTVSFGLLPEYQDRLRRGALSAAYYFLFAWAEENQVQVVDLLRCRPHACDGVYEHKRRWGAKPEVDSWPHNSIWLFVPAGCEVPWPVGQQLVWTGGEFTALGGLVQSRAKGPQPARTVAERRSGTSMPGQSARTGVARGPGS